jgi:hypothetical protein
LYGDRIVPRVQSTRRLEVVLEGVGGRVVGGAFVDRSLLVALAVLARRIQGVLAVGAHSEVSSGASHASGSSMCYV